MVSTNLTQAYLETETFMILSPNYLALSFFFFLGLCLRQVRADMKIGKNIRCNFTSLALEKITATLFH